MNQTTSMIVLFTDFGLQGPYTGQMKAVLHQMAPGISIIDLFADAPAGNPKASAYLLAAYAQWFAAGTTFLCVVDPGVGGTRPPVVVEADERWYVGPRKDDADRRRDWPDDLAEIVYVDHFGNAMTGLRAATLAPNAKLAAAGRVLERARTFGDRPPGAAFWYENSNGLAEIAVNGGRADRDLGLAIGSPVEIVV